MQFELHEHQGSINVVPKKLQLEVSEALVAAKVRKPLDTQKIRKSILEKLHGYGWSDGIRVDPTNSKIDITSMKEEVGLCFQTGNMSRFYADMLKLQTLFAEGRITSAVCIVPKRFFAKSIGQNLVNFERFVKEVKIFSKTITVPLLTYGIYE